MQNFLNFIAIILHYPGRKKFKLHRFKGLTFEQIYNDLFQIYGDLGWWPAETAEEVVVGAILTQNTNWKNVEMAIKNMKRHGIFTMNDIKNTSTERLSDIIRSSGFHNQKAKRLKNLASSIIEKYGNLDNMKDQGDASSFLSSIDGIGPETRDSILLYALGFPVFVVDKYTLRFLSRYAGITDDRNLGENVVNELLQVQKLKNFHAMIVQISKDYCRKKPECQNCPVNEKCLYARAGKIEGGSDR